MNTVSSSDANMDHGPQPNKLVFMVAMVILFSVAIAFAFPK